jgi:diguanylate cyclase (GGDEF)-like protein/PAS domain S-box-containing protein
MTSLRAGSADPTALTVVRARTLLRASDTREVFDRLVRLATVALRAPFAVLAAVDGERLLEVRQTGVPAPWSAARELLIQWTRVRWSVTGDAFVVEDPAGVVTPAPDRPNQLGPLTFCAAAVLVDGEVVAVLAVGDLQPRRWTPDDAALLRDLASALPRCLELLADRQPEPSQGLEAGRPLPSGYAARYRGLFEDCRMPLFIMSHDGVLIEVNRAMVDLIGRPREALQGTSIRDLCENIVGVDRLLQELATDGSGAEMELTFRRGSGDELVCMVSGGAYATPDGTVIYHGSIRDVTQQKRTQDELLRAAFQDPLTGLPNRLVFMDRLDRLLQHSKRRSDGRFAVLFLDLDNFKRVNDLYGHVIGDELLIAVARRVESCVRQEDTVARIGGDEFGVLLETIPDGLTVTLIVDRIREALAQPVEAEGLDMGTTASIGIAMSASGYEHAQDLLRDADAAMYRAKASGRNDYVIFDSDMHDAALLQRQLEEDLRTAMDGDQLSVHYHPVVDLAGGAVTGLEALVRWSHPTHGVLLPSAFIPLAERTGLIVEIGWWVLRQACKQLRSWQRDYPDSAFRLTISVNLSAKQFVHPTLVDQIDGILAETGLDPSLLRLDLTEAVVMQNATLASRLMTELRERGIQICIDDFGTGYSSIQQLRLFPISGLKIDRSFVGQLDDNGDDEVVQSILALGSSMEIDVIAEGVETPRQLEQLRRLGTRFAQGFLFSFPLDTTAVAALLEQTEN